MIKVSTLSMCLALVGAPVLAQTNQQGDSINAALLTGWQTKQGTHMAGLQLTLAPGWKTRPLWMVGGDVPAAERGVRVIRVDVLVTETVSVPFMARRASSVAPNGRR